MRGVKVLTEDKYDSVPALLAEGKNRYQIAEQFGVTVGSLQVQCSKRGITLRRGGAYTSRRNLSLLPEATLKLSNTVLIALREKARAMGTDEILLASNLLETIVRDDLYSAVLDAEAA